MTLTTHILSGAALGASVKNPVAIAGLAVALHFLLDMVPHGDYLNKKSRLGEFWKVAIDLAAGFFFVTGIILLKRIADPYLIQNIIIGILFSLLPDFSTFLFRWAKMKFLEPIYVFHQKLHRAPDFSPQRQFRLKNNFWDILTSLTFLLFLIFLLR